MHILIYIDLLCILATSSLCLLLLLCPYNFCPFFVPIFAWCVSLVSVIFLKRSLVFPILLFSAISLHWLLKRHSHLSLLFFGTLHSDVYIFPFLLCLLLLFFSQLFVSPPQSFCLLHFFFLGMVFLVLTKLWEMEIDRGAWSAAALAVTESRTRLSNWTTKYAYLTYMQSISCKMLT